MSYQIRAATPGDVTALVDLHRAAAAVPDGLARRPDEITRDYVERFIAGISFVAVDPDGAIWGEIHGARETVALFAHVLSNLTVAVHPDRQGLGIGSKLFEALIAHARTMDPPILRIELAAGAGNLGAIRLYERLGFRHEGRQVARGRYPDGRLEDDILMGMLI
ncbi:MAG: GNAT family N-acetyltransferase [Caulobacter sp. 35-67-4]|nr:MAG: GNAT family N-acetyltransferase [Caulobacter sp. 32-67-35]OYX97634.1 MAG: GNAT family N-acetyltransferase [Caulobacter sp. 35-67-4]OZA70628.1 MAG: GNAT family N-acetyltransferase [Caulobacter sp. 39-67-4]HQR89382.1 GNAT family N-acetyltransferase [Caulobacter sp.]